MNWVIIRQYLSSITIKPAAIVVWLAVFFGLYLTSLPSYVLFHALAELFSIVIAVGIFMLAWNAQRFLDNHYLLFVSIAYLFVAAIDTVHALAYKGMGTLSFFDPTANLATQLWIAARYLQAVSLVLAPLFLTRTIKPRLVLGAYGAVVAAIFISIFYTRTFPQAYVEGLGLTSFKVASEYIISGILALSAVLLWKGRRLLSKPVLHLLLTSIAATIASELFFTAYFGVYDFSNMAGHFLKILAFYFVYKAVIELGLKNPFEVLFTTLRRSTDVLKESETRFRSMFESAPEAVILVDGTGAITLWNKGAERMFGWRQQEAVGKRLDFIMPERYRERHKTAFESAAKSGVSELSGKTIELSGVRKDGMEFPLEMSLASWEANGEMSFGAIIRDITKRRQLNEELETRAKDLERLAKDLAKFKLAIENVEEHVILTDPDGVILYVNKAAQRITGYSEKEMIGKRPSLWGQQMTPSFYEKFWRTIKLEKKPFTGEFTNKRKNGEIYIAQAMVIPIVGENGIIQFFVGVERDVSKEKVLDKAKSEFISLAAHQLRTPLTSMSLASEMLLREVGGTAQKEVKKYAGQIYNEIRSMAEMINVFLNISRIEMGTFPLYLELLSAQDVVEEVVAAMDPQLKTHALQLKKNYAKNLPPMLLDRKILRIVLENLLSNAVKYTPAGGTITVGIEQKESSVLVSVCDTGYGIPEEEHAKVFSKTFRASNIREKGGGEGMGLGLYVAKIAIEQSGGTIWFSSAENKGTSFYIEIPLQGMKKKE